MHNGRQNVDDCAPQQIGEQQALEPTAKELPNGHDAGIEHQGTREHKEQRHTHDNQRMIGEASPSSRGFIELQARPGMLHDNQQDGYRADEV